MRAVLQYALGCGDRGGKAGDTPAASVICAQADVPADARVLPVVAARRLTFLLTYTCSAGALVLLWLVYPQDYSYGAAVGTGLQFYPGVVRTLVTSSAAMLMRMETRSASCCGQW